MERDRIETALGFAIEELHNTTIAVVGCGAVGTHLLNTLAKLPLQNITVIDRDFVDSANLATSTLFTQNDVQQTAKATAAAEHLQHITDTTITPVNADVNGRNITNLLKDCDLIFDATDNLTTRFLLNEYSQECNTPWIYTAAIAFRGQTCLFTGRETDPCFRCLIHKMPTEQETCETTGLLPGTAATIASIAATNGIKYLCNMPYSTALQYIDLYTQRYEHLTILQQQQCDTCMKNKRQYLYQPPETATLCGERAYQVHPKQPVELAQLERTLAAHGTVKTGQDILLFETDTFSMTIFPDGRAIVKGATNQSEARSLYARYIGN